MVARRAHLTLVRRCNLERAATVLTPLEISDHLFRTGEPFWPPTVHLGGVQRDIAETRCQVEDPRYSATMDPVVHGTHPRTSCA